MLEELQQALSSYFRLPVELVVVLVFILGIITLRKMQKNKQIRTKEGIDELLLLTVFGLIWTFKIGIIYSLLRWNILGYNNESPFEPLYFFLRISVILIIILFSYNEWKVITKNKLIFQFKYTIFFSFIIISLIFLIDVMEKTKFPQLFSEVSYFLLISGSVSLLIALLPLIHLFKSFYEKHIYIEK